MSFYVLKDVDWAWDDENEGRAFVVQADSPEQAVRIATEKHIAEFPGAGGVTWDVGRLSLVAFGDATWGDDNKPSFERLTYYPDGINGPPDRDPAIMSAIEPAGVGVETPPPHAHVVGLDELIENARQAASETHSSWEAMCHAILNALGFDFGEPKSFALSGRWLPIEQADKTITNVEDFSEVGIILRTSDRYWVRDEDGRVYEAAWSEGNNGERDYWWDFEGESPADPVEFMPHPLDPRFAATEGSDNG